MTLRLAAGTLACGLSDIHASINDVAYLGPRWNDDWSGVSAHLAEGSDAPTQGPILTEALEIARSPHRGDANPLFPERARKSRRSGVATPVCHIGSQGALYCGHGGEAPRGFGFSDAALAYTTVIQVEPTFATGQPSRGACVQIRVPFRVL